MQNNAQALRDYYRRRSDRISQRIPAAANSVDAFHLRRAKRRADAKIAELDALYLDGGMGSGNWGHKGVHGHHGGSAPGGGTQYRSGLNQRTGYTSLAKRRKEYGTWQKQDRRLIRQAPRGTIAEVRDASGAVTKFQKVGDDSWVDLATGFGWNIGKGSFANREMRMDLPESEADKYPNYRKTPRVPHDGADISKSYTGDGSIDDVVKTQGYDGPPQVMSRAEFDAAVAASGFVAQRNFVGSSQEMVDAYLDDLVNGPFYVNCGVGGAQYGQGMYCAADYSGNVSRGITREMAHYETLNRFRTGSSSDEMLTPQEYAKCEHYQAEAVKKVYDNQMAEHLNKYSGKEREFAELVAEKKKNWKNMTQTERQELDGKITDMWGQVQSAQDIYTGIKNADYDARQNVHNAEMLPASNFADKIGLPELAAKGKTVTMTLAPGAKIVKYKTLEKMYNKFNKGSNAGKFQDIGAFAAAMGYDAINAEGHGESGSYTVVVNRTKLIILAEDVQ